MDKALGPLARAEFAAHVVRYAAAYLVFITFFARGAYEKLALDVPDFFVRGWQGTWADSFPGLEVSWRAAGLVELASCVLLLVSVVSCEWIPGRRKTYALAGVSVGLVYFMMLAWGQQLVGANDRVAVLWFYFGATLAALAVIQHDATDRRGLETARPTGPVAGPTRGPATGRADESAGAGSLPPQSRRIPMPGRPAGRATTRHVLIFGPRPSGAAPSSALRSRPAAGRPARS